MRLIDADDLIKGRVENDPVRIAAMCAPTAFDEERYTIKEVVNAIMQADEEIICAITYRDQESLEDILTDLIGYR